MFWKIMIGAVSVLAVSWIAYAIYEYRWRMEEKRDPKKKPTTERLKKVKDSFEDYTKQMENYERKDYDRKDLE